MTDLTKSAKKSLATLYKEYRQRRKDGQEKRQAVSFSAAFAESVSQDKRELKAAGYVKIDILGNITLTDQAIILMENQKADTIKEWLTLGANLIP